MSIRYRVRKGGSMWNEQTRIRHLKDIEVAEVAVLAFPMNPLARITRVKSSAIETIASIRDLEECLRDAGFSRREAKAIASHGFDGLNRDDSDAEQQAAIDRLVASARSAGGILSDLSGV